MSDDLDMGGHRERERQLGREVALWIRIRDLEADRDAWKAKYEAAEERARFQTCAITEWKAREAKANRLREIAERKAEAAIEALTPSGATKAAYSGEFSEPTTEMVETEDGDWVERSLRVPVSWTTIKEIMTAIRDRANSEMEKNG